MNRTQLLGRCSALVALLGCNATNTGNPGDGNRPGGGPDGIELVASALERDTTPTASEAQLAAFGADARDFAFELYGLAVEDGENAFFSPYSIRVALGMIYAGAEAETEQEMATALRFTQPEPEVHEAANGTELALEGRSEELVTPDATGDVQLDIVNGVFAEKSMAFEEPFLDTLALHYGAGVYAADFLGQPDHERMAINDWVADRTMDRITDLLPERSIDASTVMVLVNAIYFKASWQDPFDPEDTEEQTFHAPGGDVSVQMMHGHASSYAEGDGWQALELPYIAPAVRMLFILPAEGRFDEIEARLDRAFVDQVRGGLGHYAVQLQLPKFTFDARLQLEPALTTLGMEQAFMEGIADFSDIAGAPGVIHIADVYHKAFIALDEQGTEAAAATAVVAVATSAPPPAELILDRPFIFMIYDEPTGQVLFLGRLLDPS